MLVFLSHLDWSASNHLFQKIFYSGYVGVSFFFVLSGFVLSYSYQEKILKGDITFKKYFFLRFARLTPLHFGTALPIIGLALYFGNFNLSYLILNLSYMQSWIPNSTIYYSFNAPSWSLSNEMFFYLCFFFLVKIPLSSLLRFGALLLLTVFVSALVVTLFLDDLKLYGNSTLAHWMFYIFPGFRLLEFIAGMLLFHLWKRGYVFNSYVLPFAYLTLFLAMYFGNHVPEAFKVSLFFLPVIVFFLFSHLQDHGFIIEILRSKPFVLLGNASFAFYLIHQPLITAFTKILASLNIGDFSFFLIALLIISLLSIAVHLTYEKWFERRLREFAKKIY